MALIIAAVLLVLATAAGIWWRVQPRLGDSGPSAAFRSHDRLELPAPVRSPK